MLRLTKLDEGQVYQRGSALGYAATATCGDLTESSERAVLLQAMIAINEHIDEVAVAAGWRAAAAADDIVELSPAHACGICSNPKCDNPNGQH